MDVSNPTGANPLGASQAGDISQLFASGYALQNSNALASEKVNQAKIEQDAADAAAREAAKRQEDLADPKKYRVIQREDGGYGFYAPDGTEVSAAQYAALSGKTPDEVLSKSENPIDRNFKEDYKALRDYANAKANSKFNTDDATKATQIEQAVKQAHGVDLHKLTLQQAYDALRQAYPTVYGGHNQGVNVNQRFIPSPGADFGSTSGLSGIGNS